MIAKQNTCLYYWSQY